jgi:two-component system, LytTR family, response regulator LytT
MTHKKKILLVEDRSLIFNDIAAFLEDKGYVVLRKANNQIVATYEDGVELFHSEHPDLAILDVQLKSVKDGIELAAYIQQHSNMPIIFMSEFDTFENIERAKQLMPNAFIVKTKKPLDTKQLWAAVNMAVPHIQKTNIKSPGIFLKVTEIELPIVDETSEEKDPIDKETLFNWDDLIYIEAGKQIKKNHVLIHTYNRKKGYLYRSSLKQLETELPEHFIRIHDNHIINASKITHRKLPSKVYIDSNVFDISETYRKEAVEKINIVLGC